LVCVVILPAAFSRSPVPGNASAGCLCVGQGPKGVMVVSSHRREHHRNQRGEGRCMYLREPHNWWLALRDNRLRSRRWSVGTGRPGSLGALLQDPHLRHVSGMMVLRTGVMELRTGMKGSRRRQCRLHEQRR
jgi:hypothetical protein